MNTEFSFIIAKVWDDTKPANFPNLAIYRYCEDIHTGSMTYAVDLLREIQLKNKKSVYRIYPVTLGTPLNE